MDSEKLLPCPFCGAKAFARKHTPGFGFSWLIEVRHGDTCPIRTNDYVMCHKTLKSAVAEWNTRPTPENGLREALEAAEDALREHACHGGEGVPCIRAHYQCQLECGKSAGDALIKVLSALQHNTGERGS